jgi:hypothetical protein
MANRMRRLVVIAIAAVSAVSLGFYLGWVTQDRSAPAAGADRQAPSGSPVAASTAPSPQPSWTLQTRSAAPSPSGNSRSAVPAGWPSTANTGVRPGVRLATRNGTVKVTRNGAVVQGLEIHGDVVVLARNVTIRNCRIIGGGSWGILQRQEAGGGLTVEDTEIVGGGGAPLEFGVLNYSGMVTVRRTEVHTMMSAVQTSQGLIEESYFHDPKDFPGAHVTLVASNSGPRSGMSLVVRHNTILNPVDQTAAVALYQDFGLNHDVLVQNNLLAGGGYTVYGGKGKYGTPYNIRFVGNVFSRRYYPKGGSFGWGATWDGSGRGNVWQGNVWQETGKPVPEP